MSKSLYICKPLFILLVNMTAYVILIQNKELLSCTLYALMSQVRKGYRTLADFLSQNCRFFVGFKSG